MKIPEVITEKIQKATKEMVENKIPGLDDVLNTALAVAVKKVPRWFPETLTTYLKEGIFRKSRGNKSLS